MNGRETRFGTAFLIAAILCVAFALASCDAGSAKSADSGSPGSDADTPQRFIQIEGDVEKYVSMKTGTPAKDDSALPGDADFEGVPLTEFIAEAGVSGSPREIWIMSSGDGFAVKTAWDGAEKAYVLFSDIDGWRIVAPEHPVSVNAMDVDRIVVASEGGQTGLHITKADGSSDIVPFGKILTAPMRLSYHLEGKADTVGGSLTSEVYTRELSVSLADVYDAYAGGGFEITTKDGARYLTDGGGRFSVSKQIIDYIETTGDIYEDVAQISFRGE
jgi:hypothetical protein